MKKLSAFKKITIFLSVPFILMLFLLILIIPLLFFGDSERKFSGANVGISAEVLQYKDEILAEMEKQGLDEKWLPLVLALVQQESGGNSQQHPDIFQASESLGYPLPDMIDTQRSIEAGISAFKLRLKQAEQTTGHEPITTDENDVRIVLTLYNVPAFGDYLKNNHGGVWSKEANDHFYTAILPSYGVGPGDKEYSDHVLRYYSFETGDYISDNGFSFDGDFDTIIGEAYKYNGWGYVWAGNNPSVGFDCSGLVQWSYAQAGINLSRTSQQQWENDVTPISPEEAEVGYLVFFAPINPSERTIIHVGIYIGDNKMFNAEPKGIRVSDLSEWSRYPTYFGRLKRTT